MRLLSQRRRSNRGADHDPRSYGPDGFDRAGFDRAGLHRDTRDRFGPDGQDRDGHRAPDRWPILRLR